MNKQIYLIAVVIKLKLWSESVKLALIWTSQENINNSWISGFSFIEYRTLKWKLHSSSFTSWKKLKSDSDRFAVIKAILQLYFNFLLSPLSKNCFLKFYEIATPAIQWTMLKNIAEDKYNRSQKYMHQFRNSSQIFFLKTVMQKLSTIQFFRIKIVCCSSPIDMIGSLVHCIRCLKSLHSVSKYFGKPLIIVSTSSVTIKDQKNIYYERKRRLVW